MRLLISVIFVMCCSSALCINIATPPAVSPFDWSVCIFADAVVIILYPSFM